MTTAVSTTRSRGLVGSGRCHSLAVRPATEDTRKGSSSASGPRGVRAASRTDATGTPATRSRVRPRQHRSRAPPARRTTPTATPRSQVPWTVAHSHATGTTAHGTADRSEARHHRATVSARSTRPASCGRSPQAAAAPNIVMAVAKRAGAGPASARHPSSTAAPRASTRTSRTTWMPAIPPASWTADMPTWASHWVGTYARSARAARGSGPAPKRSPERRRSPMRRCSQRSTSGDVRTRSRRPATRPSADRRGPGRGGRSTRPADRSGVRRARASVGHASLLSSPIRPADPP